MKPIGIIKPLRINAAGLRKNIRKDIGGRYETVSVLSLPQMLYFVPSAENGTSETGRNVFNITLGRSESTYRLAAYFKDLGSYSATRRMRNLRYMSDSLFKTYTGLNQLTQALWRIYNSNNLQLSHSLFALIRSINERNRIELEPYFEGLPNIVRVQKRTIGVLKSINHSLFGRSYSRYEKSSAVNIERRGIYRYADTVNRSYGKTSADISRFTENFNTMTPLLMRIYEGIETGVYLYNADSYRNAKTLQRLTNSLWKVYLGQNMELSRSFSRLITRVNQENKSIELRNSENNMFSDNRSLKNLVNALRKAFSGSNLELRNSMISLFSDIHKAGSHKNIAVNKHYDLRHDIGVILLHKEIVPEYEHIRLDHRKFTRSDSPVQSDAYSRVEHEIKTKLGQSEMALSSTRRAGSVEDIVKDVLDKVNRKQQLDWRLEKLQRGLF